MFLEEILSYQQLCVRFLLHETYTSNGKFPFDKISKIIWLHTQCVVILPVVCSQYLINTINTFRFRLSFILWWSHDESFVCVFFFLYLLIQNIVQILKWNISLFYVFFSSTKIFPFLNHKFFFFFFKSTYPNHWIFKNLTFPLQNISQTNKFSLKNLVLPRKIRKKK